MTGAVSFVIPVFNGAGRLRRVIEAVQRDAGERPHEIIVIDDGSTDESESIASASSTAVRVIRGPRLGAAAAMNAGIREARHPFIAQVDQDVEIQRGWVDALVARMDDPSVAAVQGRYVVAADAGFWARVTGRDLDLRYAALGPWTDHVCTGNAVYRAAAIHQAGLFDERMGYGYDNDLSYRLGRAGYRLAFEPCATAIHFWRDSATGYVRHQYGVGYGRLDVIRSHPRRAAGDMVSGAVMIAHAPLMLAAIALLAIGIAWPPSTRAASGLLAVLALERAVAGWRAWNLTRDPVALLFPVVHLVRDAIWAAAIATWTARRIVRHDPLPRHSMPRRSATVTSIQPLDDPRALVLVPAYNEAENLPDVVEDLRRHLPETGVLVIDDASTDRTRELLPDLGVAWLSLPQRLGVGGALRAGVRFARRRGHRVVVRVDGDGQHRAADAALVIAPVVAGRADAVAGSRRLGGHQPPPTRRITQRLLATCLSMLTGERVTDPTSGLWAFGPRALDLLLEHHPGGYPEPELRLLFARHGLCVIEVPVGARRRQAGRTSLTFTRTLIAFARTTLAMLTAPLAARRTDE